MINFWSRTFGRNITEEMCFSHYILSVAHDFDLSQTDAVHFDHLIKGVVARLHHSQPLPLLL